MSASAAPWSVKGIDPKAREIAKDLARRSGMTLGEWLNSMIMHEPDEDDQVATLPRRTPVPDPYDRRNRSRRLDDAYGGPSLEVIADRLEAVERRSTEAVRSIEEAVAGLVRRIDRQDEERQVLDRRLDGMASELREGHQRLKKVELSAEAPDQDRLVRVSRRLDEAQIHTQAALQALERSFATLDERLRQTESRADPDTPREASRFERLAETLSRQVEGNRIEMMRRLDVVEIESRADRLELALANITEHSRQAEQKSAAAVEAMGREVMRIAQNLNTRVGRVEQGDQIEKLGRALSDKLERDMERHTQAVDLRLTRSDDHNARAIERLGDEITRISDRLSDRIANSERRSAEALEDISRRLVENSERIDLRHQMQGDLADRMRQSEERTAQLLAEARESMSQRARRPTERAVETDDFSPSHEIASQGASPAVAEATPARDWRSAAFGQMPDLWSDDDLDGLLDAAPFPGSRADLPQAAAGRDVPLAAADPVPIFADPIEAELSAWVEARSREVAPSGLFAARPEQTGFGSLRQSLTDEGETSSASPDETVHGAGHPDPMDRVLAEAGEVGASDPTPASEAVEPLVFRSASDLDDLGVDEGFDGLMDRPLDAPVGNVEAGGDAAPADDLMGEAAQAVADTDPLVLDTGAAAGRLSTREALDAARAAMVEPEEAVRKGFGIKRRGGKSKLQERLDKQARGEGGTLRKTLGASVLAALVVGGGYGFLELSEMTADADERVPPATDRSGVTSPMAAMALAATPTEATPASDLAQTEAATLFERAAELLDKGDDGGLQPLVRAAELGHVGAQLRLAGLYEDGQAGLEADAVEARSWARRAAEGGDALAMHYYAMQLYHGTGGPQNRAAALGWLKRAAEAGRVDSQYNVARLYEMGDTGVAKDPLQAFTWYMIAARRGDQQALAAVQRLTPLTDTETRRKARNAADAFSVDPVA